MYMSVSERYLITFILLTNSYQKMARIKFKGNLSCSDLQDMPKTFIQQQFSKLNSKKNERIAFSR